MAEHHHHHHYHHSLQRTVSYDNVSAFDGGAHQYKANRNMSDLMHLADFSSKNKPTASATPLPANEHKMTLNQMKQRQLQEFVSEFTSSATPLSSPNLGRHIATPPVYPQVPTSIYGRTSPNSLYERPVTGFQYHHSSPVYSWGYTPFSATSNTPVPSVHHMPLPSSPLAHCTTVGSSAMTPSCSSCGVHGATAKK